MIVPVDPWARVLRLTDPLMTGPDVVAMQRAIHVPDTGVFDRATMLAVAAWQDVVMSVPVTDPLSGIVGQFTAKRMGISG